jgi:hypothetical protein
MRHHKWVTQSVGGAFLVISSFYSSALVFAQSDYPADYKVSKTAEKGETNVLARVVAVSDYMTAKLNAAGGEKSPMCYRNCLTISFNEVLKCTEAKGSYVASESCEKDAAQRMSSCDPKCQ